MSLNLSLDIKCAVTTAIISVLIYLILELLLKKSFDKNDSVLKPMNNDNWFISIEFMMLITVIIAYNINYALFGSCKSKSQTSV